MGKPYNRRLDQLLKFTFPAKAILKAKLLALSALIKGHTLCHGKEELFKKNKWIVSYLFLLSLTGPVPGIQIDSILSRT